MAAQNPPLALLGPGELLYNDGVQAGVGRSVGLSGLIAQILPSTLPTALPAAMPAALAATLPAALTTLGYATVASGLVASGTTIANGYPITTQRAFFGTVVGTNVAALLPSPTAVPYPITVGNFGVSGLSLFPPTVSGQINTAGSGVVYSLASGTVANFWFAGGQQFYHS